MKHRDHHREDTNSTEPDTLTTVEVPPQFLASFARAEEYVRGIFWYTNTVESYFALLKRGIMGSFHHVSKDYLPLYLNEFSFRANNRKNPDMFGEMVTTCGQ